MRAILAISFILSLQIDCVAQNKFFIGSEGDYVILLNEDAGTKSTTTQTGYVDYFIFRENNTFNFMLSITKANISGIDTQIIYSEEYKKSFLDECNCQIWDEEKVSFANFGGVLFKIESSIAGKPVKGYSVSTVTAGILFTVNFLALEIGFEKLKGEYERAMNSLIFKY